MPLISLLWPAVLYFHGLYQVKRGRSRIDELFAIVFSVLIGSALVLGATLYVRVYHRFQPDVAPLWEYSQAVFALFVVTDVLLLYVGRAGSARLARAPCGPPATTSSAWWSRARPSSDGTWPRPSSPTASSATAWSGFLDDPRRAQSRRPSRPRPLDRGPGGGRGAHSDQIYVALPLEDHAKIVGLIKSLGTECLDVKVVPDLVQYATIQAALEDLDGIPIISLNETPLHGFNSMVKRVMDIAAGSLLLALPLSRSCSSSPCSSSWGAARGPSCFAQERMTVDGKTLPDLQVPHHGGRRREDDGPGLRDRRRPAAHPHRGRSCALQPRRAARSS